MEENQQTTCASNGVNYAIQCDILYEGVEIDTSDINEVSPSSTTGVPSPSAAMIEVLPRTSNSAFAPSATEIYEADESGTDGMSGPGLSIPIESDDIEDDEDDMSDMEGMDMLRKRAIVPDVESCRNLCDRTSGCRAFNFVGNNCTLFSSVTGYSYAPGAVGGAVYDQGEAPPTPIDTSPVCPASAGKTFTDDMDVTYDIVCYTQYEGSYISGIAPFSSNNLASCLPTCDRNVQCAGVVYDTSTRQCRLLSALDGLQRGNNNFIAAIRVGGPPAYSGGASSSTAPATVTTTLDQPPTTLCKLNYYIPLIRTSANRF